MNQNSFILIIPLLLIFFALSGCQNPSVGEPEYSVSIVAVGADVGEIITSDISSSLEGSVVTLTADLNADRQVDFGAIGITITPSNLTTDGGTSTFVMPASDVSVTATFSDIPPDTFDISIIPIGNETGESVVPDLSSAEAGTTITLAADLNLGRQVDFGATGVTFTPSGLTTDGGTSTFVMPASDVSVTATFSDIPPTYYTVNFEVTDADFSRILPGVTITVEGSDLTITNSSGLTNTSLIPGTYSYSATAPAYDSLVSETFTVSDASIDIPVELSRSRCNTTFSVMNGSTPIPDASIEVGGTIDFPNGVYSYPSEAVGNTDSQGNLSIELYCGGEYSYSIQAEDHYNTGDSIVVANTDETSTINVTMNPRPQYTVTFTVTEDSLPIEGAIIDIAKDPVWGTYSETLITDALGVASTTLYSAVYDYAVESLHHHDISTTEISVSSNTSIPIDMNCYTVGEIGPNGGYIFYDDTIGYDPSGGVNLNTGRMALKNPGTRYLECATSDITLYGVTVEWINSELQNSFIGAEAQGLELGDGWSNSQAILGDVSHTDSAAEKCTILSGFFLPSREELFAMYDVLYSSTGTFGAAGVWWSSSEFDGNSGTSAWSVSFSSSSRSEGFSTKSSPRSIRPITMF